MAQSKEKLYAFDLAGAPDHLNQQTIFGTYYIKIVDDEPPSSLKILTAILKKEIKELNCIFDNAINFWIDNNHMSKIEYLHICYPGNRILFFHVFNIRKF